MQQIGRYQVLGELGRGAMGVVYRAQDPAIGRIIAIKTIRLSDLTEPAERERMRDRLFREAQSAGILSHPNIVTIYDILEQDGMAYIFMEYVNGPALEKLLADEQPPDRQTLMTILRQTGAALDYAHKKGIIHRDIKPGNIMIHEDGCAKITDFGVAKIVSQQMTQTGMMMGTPSYMSPEQVQGGAVDGRADQFALGVIAYEMLTGEKPFVAEYLPSLLYKICREDPAPPQRLNTTLSSQSEAVLRRALAKSPNDRYETCSDFIADLERALAAKPDWSPLPRGTSQNMPTVATSSAVAMKESGTDASVERVDAAVTSPPPVSQVQVPPPTVAPSASRTPIRLEDSESHTVRNVVLALASLVVIGLAILVAQKWTAPKPTSATSELQTSVSAPAAPKASPSEPTLPPSPVQKPEPGQRENSEKQESSKTEPRERPEKAGPSRERAQSVPSSPGPEQPIQFASNPPGATIVVDDNPAFTCVAPCQLPLAPGRHTLTATADGYRIAHRIFETPREASINLSLDRMMGALSITTEPAGATIKIDGQTRPEKTPAVINLPVGTHRLEVVGWEPEDVQIKDGAIRQLKYTK
ncbi:MAG TPA: protein kinase [Bryobacteraceae bacterium]|nr:protein kinase [Bryobacteraceae bacterium]